VILRPACLLFRLAAIGVMAAALAGCGRKGALDLPPGAALDQTTALPQDQAAPSATLVDSMSANRTGKPIAPQGPKKRIPLDVLLN
jgi:predicted small lipoprotein YifL